MKIYEVLIEYVSSSLDRPFSYFYNGTKKINTLCRVIVPFNHKPICGVVVNIIEVNSIEEYQKNTGFEIKEIADVIDETPLLNEELSLLCDEIASYYFSPKISVFFSMLPPSLKPALSYKNKPKIAYEYLVKTCEGFSYDGLTTKQAELLYKIDSSDVYYKRDCSPTLLNALLKKGKVALFEVEKNRLKKELVRKQEDLILNEEQLNAYNSILFDENESYLLEGVTGSGKTEVYLQVSREIIKQNKTVLMIVPEISLSYQMVNRFSTRFDRIAVLHSELTPAERYDEYRRISQGEVDIVIGARSAIFAPLDNIGLVIIDEEHSETYKQEDKMPYYNAITVAKMRQKYHHFKLVLGSATPSLETKSRAMRGVYKQLNLSNRVNGLQLPKVEIVDMSNYHNIDRESVLISKQLRAAITDRLNKKEQVILLVNRRGYSPYVSCRKCGKVIKCPTCDVALTYHYETDMLMCHHCGYEERMIKECPNCSSDKIFKSGFGTEKIEKIIKDLFPDSRVLRLDSDVSKKRKASSNVIRKFINREADILIGTQIVAKGHDFNGVTLVGIVLADIGLAIPSYKAGERTFSLITQAIGRSGREKQGEAIIQTYQKDHYVIKYSSKQDYLSFFAKEIKYRKLMRNPPYMYLALLIISGSNLDDVIDASYETKNYLLMHFEEDETVDVVGPSEMFIKLFNKQFRRKIILKYKSYDNVKEQLRDLRMFFNSKSNISLTINIDPYEDY